MVLINANTPSWCNTDTESTALLLLAHCRLEHVAPELFPICVKRDLALRFAVAALRPAAQILNTGVPYSFSPIAEHCAVQIALILDELVLEFES